MTPLISFPAWSFQKRLASSQKENEVNINACPNCWGRQEWCDQYIPVSLTQTRDQWDFSKFRNGFILNFVNKYL